MSYISTGAPDGKYVIGPPPMSVSAEPPAPACEIVVPPPPPPPVAPVVP